MQPTSVPSRIVPSTQAAMLSKESEPALSVTTVYQDPLTRHWAAELWDRVGQLVGHGGICHRSWRIGDLTNAQVFTGAVRAAAEADVLVVSVRDVGELPMNLCVWIDAWMPRRTMRAGALVSLIGVSPQPDGKSGRAHEYLGAVARRAGLDFLPRERKLPEEPSALPTLGGITPPAASLTMPWSGGTLSPVAGVCLHRRLTE